MQNLYKFDKLNFITAGMPLRTGKGSYPQAFDVLKEMALDGMELEFWYYDNSFHEKGFYIDEIFETGKACNNFRICM